MNPRIALSTIAVSVNAAILIGLAAHFLLLPGLTILSTLADPGGSTCRSSSALKYRPISHRARKTQRAESRVHSPVVIRGPFASLWLGVRHFFFPRKARKSRKDLELSATLPIPCVKSAMLLCPLHGAYCLSSRSWTN